MQDSTNYKVWKKALIVFCFWVAIFLSSLMGALYVLSIYAEKSMEDWVFYHDRGDDLEEQHTQYFTYALFANDLKVLAENKDYEAILNKACWLLLISTPKLTPEVWDENSARRIHDAKVKDKAQETLQDLFDSGYCSQYTREEFQAILSK